MKPRIKLRLPLGFTLIIGVKSLGAEQIIWQVEQVNLITDYRQVFGQDPPQVFTIGIMNDSVNTKEQSVSYLDEIKLNQ